jgi:signal recognition particle GTPase
VPASPNEWAARRSQFFSKSARLPCRRLQVIATTFRAAAIEQLKLWGARLKVEVIASAYGSDAASVAHDAVTAAIARQTD